MTHATVAGGPAALLLIGTVGSGKTTTAAAIGDVLSGARVPHAVIDLDELRRSWPAPPGDPFQQTLELANLRAVARVYARHGADRLVLAGVVEQRDDRALYEDAVGMPLSICRLRLALPAVHDRLDRRHQAHDAAREWHRHRAGELDAVLDAAG